MTAKAYDITNVETGETWTNVSAKEIRTDIVEKGINVSQYVRTGKKYKNWLIEEHFEVDTREKGIKGLYPFTEQTFMEWNKVCSKFRHHVTWVKEGGRRLRMGE